MIQRSKIENAVAALLAAAIGTLGLSTSSHAADWDADWGNTGDRTVVIERQVVEPPIVRREIIERPIVRRVVVERPVVIERPVIVRRPVIYERVLYHRPVVRRVIVDRPAYPRVAFRSDWEHRHWRGPGWRDECWLPEQYLCR